MVSNDGLEFPVGYCNRKGIKTPHFFVHIGSGIWRCTKCWAVKWLPSSMEEAVKFDSKIRRFGVWLAYNTELSDRPKTKSLLEKLEELRLAWKYLTTKKFNKLLRETILDKEFSAVCLIDKPKKQRRKYARR